MRTGLRVRPAVLLVLTIATALPAWLFACDDRSDEEAISREPIVGLMELPVSLRTAGAAPSNAVKIEVSPTELRVESRPVLHLSNGRTATNERSGNVLTKVATALRSGPARSRAEIHLHAVVPYETLVFLMRTLSAANIRSVMLAVRRPDGGTTQGWLELAAFKVVEPTDQEVTFDNIVPRPWPDFLAHWEDVRDSCRMAGTVECSPKPEKIAEGGHLQITLRARGDGVRVEYTRVGAPAPEAPRPAAVEMIEGVPNNALVQEALEAQVAPATEATFAVRAEQTTASPSRVSGMVRPVCGSSACGVVVIADRLTMVARVVSLIGAAFPDGSTAPTIAFMSPRG